MDAVRCSKGAAPHFYTEKVGNRWWICDPLGNGFFLKGVYDMEGFGPNTATETFIKNKYASGPEASATANWGLEQLRRLQLWGFNTVAEYAWNGLWPGTGDIATDQIKLPFSVPEMTTHYAFINGGGECGASALKDMMNGAGSAYTGYRWGFGDYFDPHFSTCVGNNLEHDKWNLQLALNSGNNRYLLYIDIDESDQTGFLDAGPDFETVEGPDTGVLSGGHTSPNAAWITLVTAPTQSSNKSQGVTYSDATVYTKQELSNWLSSRYGGSIEALNAAWKAHYTTFGSAGGWGGGTGLLDENGTCPSRGGSACWVGDPYTLGKSAEFPAAETSAMKADMSAFYVHYLDQYFSVETAQYRKYAPGVMLNVGLGNWGSPVRREALTEAAKYIDLPTIGQTPAWPCLNCTDQQARIDFTARYLGDRPWINWEGFYALPDSAESAYATPNPAYSTQAARGAGYQSMVSAMINAKTTAYGSNPIVGFDWWGLYDMDNQQANWGLLTPHDNPYDGKSATISGAGKDQWGYATGGEKANYGDFLSAVTAANYSMLARLIAQTKGHAE